MNTKLLMSASGAFMALLGLAASLFPQAVLRGLSAASEEVPAVVVSIAGALYLGIGILDWMARGNLIGGVYSRPVAMGNFVVFLMVAITLAKQVFAAPNTVVYALAAGIHAIFAAAFGYVLFGMGGQCG